MSRLSYCIAASPRCTRTQVKPSPLPKVRSQQTGYKHLQGPVPRLLCEHHHSQSPAHCSSPAVLEETPMPAILFLPSSMGNAVSVNEFFYSLLSHCSHFLLSWGITGVQTQYLNAGVWPLTAPGTPPLPSVCPTLHCTIAGHHPPATWSRQAIQRPAPAGLPPSTS